MINITSQGTFLYNKREPIKSAKTKLILFSAMYFTTYEHQFFRGNNHLSEDHIILKTEHFKVYWSM